MGRVVTQETLRKKSIALKGRPPSAQTMAAVRGVAKSLEHRQKLRLTAATLTPDQVMSIRQRYAAGEMQKRLAVEFGVCTGNIQAIILGITWKNLPVIPRLVCLGSRGSRCT
jgi:hypothetical protein